MAFYPGDRVVVIGCAFPSHGTVRTVTHVSPASDVVDVDLDDGGHCSVSVADVQHEAPSKLVVRPPKVSPPERSAILKDADALINGERQAEYGPPSVNFQRIADMWAVLFPERQWTTGDVARAMAAVKLARSAQSFSRDTAVDLAGYAALYGELEATA